MAATQHSVNKKLVFFQLLFIALMVGVIGMFATGHIPSTSFITSLITPHASYTPKPIRVLEVRFYPYDSAAQEQKTQLLSDQLVADMTEASKPKGYKNPNALPYAAPVIDKVNGVVRVYRSSPKVTGSNEQWFDSLNAILTGLPEKNLCDYIVANNIDQVWGWFDVRAPGAVPAGDAGGYNREFTRVYSNAVFPRQLPVPLCGGKRTFVFFGFDQNRTREESMHSFGHSAEELFANIQGNDLFWNNWSGGKTTPPIRRGCGTVHIPPNTTDDYDYSNKSDTVTQCEDWKPDQTGSDTYPTCARWGCTEQGYLRWWFQNMPNANNGLVYQGKPIPNWWDFMSDTDVAMANAVSSGQYMTGQFANVVLPSSTPKASPTTMPTTVPTPVPSPTSKVSPNPSTPPSLQSVHAPFVDIKVNGRDRYYGAVGRTPLTLTWTTANATSCVAKGAWSGTKATSGSFVIPTSTVVPKTVNPDFYALQCTGTGGAVWYDVVYIISSVGGINGGAFNGKMFVNGFDDTVMPISSGLPGAGTQQKAVLIKGSSLTVSWSSNASWCGYGAKTPTSGSEVKSPVTANTTYSLTCSMSQTVSGVMSVTAYVQ